MKKSVCWILPGKVAEVKHAESTNQCCFLSEGTKSSRSKPVVLASKQSNSTLCPRFRYPQYGRIGYRRFVEVVQSVNQTHDLRVPTNSQYHSLFVECLIENTGIRCQSIVLNNLLFVASSISIVCSCRYSAKASSAASASCECINSVSVAVFAWRLFSLAIVTFSLGECLSASIVACLFQA